MNARHEVQRPMEAYFDELVAILDGARLPGERYQALLDAEDSQFVRMNQGKVRQPGHVAQRYLTVRLVRGARHASCTLSLSGVPPQDRQALAQALADLRGVLPGLADDPHLLLPEGAASSHAVHADGLPDGVAMVDDVLEAAAGEDLVGLLATGAVQRGFASSEGQRNWHESATFNLQWSLYHRADKAVKSAYAGFAWDRTALEARMSAAREGLALVTRPPRALEPGRYRAYLAPSALEEVTGLLGWGGVSARALATQQSPLARMRAGMRLAPIVAMAEDFTEGVAPAFQAEGFARPPRVPLIDQGALVGSLVSPRSAREFDLATNGANASESPESLVMQGGSLARADALAALDTGLAIGNLWYLNYSDRPSCRVTGMTRFATFWVEGGHVVAPVNVLRFDDSVYRLLGESLEALTRETELLLDPSSYGARTLSSARLPGALVRDMTFTL
jgi:predicted Zn-dependent protease